MEPFSHREGVLCTLMIRVTKPKVMVRIEMTIETYEFELRFRGILKWHIAGDPGEVKFQSKSPVGISATTSITTMRDMATNLQSRFT